MSRKRISRLPNKWPHVTVFPAQQCFAAGSAAALKPTFPINSTPRNLMFKIVNQSARTWIFADQKLLPFAGMLLNDMPKDFRDWAAKLPGFQMFPALDLDEDAFFKTHKTAIAGMQQKNLAGSPLAGKPELVVIVDGTELTIEDVHLIAADYRASRGMPQPTTPKMHREEAEKFRPTLDHFDGREAREAKAAEQSAMIAAVVAEVLKHLESR